MRRLLIAIMACCMVSLAGAQSLPLKKHGEVVYKNDYFISASQYDYSSVALDIVGNETSRYKQAQLLYLWICRNICYDKNGAIRDADTTWLTRKAVCQGYCELFYRLAEPLKLKVHLIYGKVKLPTANTIEEHVWLSINTEQGRILADPTWGAAILSGPHFGQAPDPLQWFDVKPEELIKTHLPAKKKYQYLKPSIKEEDWQ